LCTVLICCVSAYWEANPLPQLTRTLTPALSLTAGSTQMCVLLPWCTVFMCWFKWPRLLNEEAQRPCVQGCLRLRASPFPACLWLRFLRGGAGGSGRGTGSRGRGAIGGGAWFSAFCGGHGVGRDGEVDSRLPNWTAVGTNGGRRGRGTTGGTSDRRAIRASSTDEPMVLAVGKSSSNLRRIPTRQVIAEPVSLSPPPALCRTGTSKACTGEVASGERLSRRSTRVCDKAVAVTSSAFSDPPHPLRTVRRACSVSYSCWKMYVAQYTLITLSLRDRK